MIYFCASGVHPIRQSLFTLLSLSSIMCVGMMLYLSRLPTKLHLSAEHYSLQLHNSSTQRDVRVGMKLGHIGPKWVKSRTF